MNKKFIITLTCMLSVFVLPTMAGPKKKVHTIGDSTMSSYSENSSDRHGWGQMLPLFFNSDVTIDNRGKSGASSKSFYNETSFWPTMVKGGVDEMKPGDYLLIQFSHNDEKCNGADGDELKSYFRNRGAINRLSDIDYRGTTPFDTYRTYLHNYINEAKEMGVKPIVVGSICRKNFSQDGKEIARVGRHDLGDKFSVIKNKLLLEGQRTSETDHTYDYMRAAKEVAEEYDDVPFIDLTTLTAKMMVGYGEKYCTDYLFVKGDKSHLTGLGATLVARMFAKEVKNQAASETNAKKKAVLAGLAENVVLSTGISFGEVSGYIGETYVGTEITRTYQLSAFDLPSESGKITVSATSGYQISVDGNDWKSSLSLDYSGSCLISDIHVKAAGSTVGVLSGKLTATDGKITKSMDLTAGIISRPVGDNVECFWALNTASLSPDTTVFEASDVTMSGMVSANNAQNPTSPNGHCKMHLFTIEGGTWPGGEMSEVPTRFIQFKAKNPAGKIFNLDEISLDICGWGGNSTSFRIYFSTKEDFSDKILIGEGSSIATKKAISISKSFVSRIAEGGDFYLRIYPWLSINGTSQSKYVGVSSVTIKGVRSTPPPAPKTKTAAKKTAGKKRR